MSTAGRGRARGHREEARPRDRRHIQPGKGGHNPITAVTGGPARFGENTKGFANPQKFSDYQGDGAQGRKGQEHPRAGLGGTLHTILSPSTRTGRSKPHPEHFQECSNRGAGRIRCSETCSWGCSVTCNVLEGHHTGDHSGKQQL